MQEDDQWHPPSCCPCVPWARKCDTRHSPDRIRELSVSSRGRSVPLPNTFQELFQVRLRLLIVRIQDNQGLQCLHSFRDQIVLLTPLRKFLHSFHIIGGDFRVRNDSGKDAERTSTSPRQLKAAKEWKPGSAFSCCYKKNSLPCCLPLVPHEISWHFFIKVGQDSTCPS